jgi:hypothetical protein
MLYKFFFKLYNIYMTLHLIIIINKPLAYVLLPYIFGFFKFK